MGEIAEMMLDGTLCECCGVYLGEASDISRRCTNCGDLTEHQEQPKRKRAKQKPAPKEAP